MTVEYIEKWPPNPGSAEAAKLGCICPVIDNHFGNEKSVRHDDRGYPLFWISEGCPVHCIVFPQECEDG